MIYAMGIERRNGKRHILLNVCHEFLLHDSMEAIMSLNRKDLRKAWEILLTEEANHDDN